MGMSLTIWKQSVSLAKLNQSSTNTLIAHLGIEYIGFDDNSLSASMPVDPRTHQPIGMLHGGASVVLAETLGSMAANLCVDETQYCVGLEINANHIRSIRKGGGVIGIASPLHLGSTTQVWQIDIKNTEGKIICVSRHTVAVLNRKNTDIW